MLKFADTFIVAAKRLYTQISFISTIYLFNYVLIAELESIPANTPVVNPLKNLCGDMSAFAEGKIKVPLFTEGNYGNSRTMTENIFEICSRVLVLSLGLLCAINENYSRTH
jgi:hypothetical protein